MEPIILNHSVEIVLTPQFYTFIREELDVKFTYQAKQIAESLFDDYLDGSIEHQYHVNKCEDRWCFFAYNIEEIDHFLKSVGIEKHRVSKIYFAQDLSKELVEPIQLDNQSALQTVNGIVTLIPQRFMGENVEYQQLNLSAVKLNSGITMGASLNSFISLKEALPLSLLFIILGSVFMVEGYRTQASISNEKSRVSELLSQYPKYSNSGIRANILETYKPINRQERNKRESLKEISRFLSKKSQLTQLKIVKDTIEADIEVANEKINKQVSRNAKAKNFKVINNGLNMKVEKKI